MDLGSAQIQGRRSRQEDACSAEPLDDGTVLAIVADGLGGHPAGDVASREGVAAFRSEFLACRAGPDPPAEWMRRSVLAAHRHLIERQRRESALTGMATTLVAAYVRDARLWAATVGDSYLLLLRDDRLVLLNELHSADGAITSCVGLSLTRVDLADGLALVPGDRLLLASDGLAPLGEDDMGRILASADGAAAAATALVEAVAALDLPAQDNATAVVVVP